VMGIEPSIVMTARKLTHAVTHCQLSTLTLRRRSTPVDDHGSLGGLDNRRHRPVAGETLRDLISERRSVLERGTARLDVDDDLGSRRLGPCDERHQRVSRRLRPPHALLRGCGRANRRDDAHRSVGGEPDRDRDRPIILGMPREPSVGNLLGCLTGRDPAHRRDQPGGHEQRCPPCRYRTGRSRSRGSPLG
jgi:hypothetical protein